MTITERRKSQRVQVDLSVAVTGMGAEARGRALNISTGGIYFESPHYLSPLTKVRLDLRVPNAKSSMKESSVSCEGVVVRVEPEQKDPSVKQYRVAILFTQVPEHSLEILDKFIRSKLSS